MPPQLKPYLPLIQQLITNPLLYIAILFVVFMAYYVWFVRRAMRNFDRNIPPFPPMEMPFVSVIIPARNEAYNIAKCLHSILYQNYPIDKYEIIVVNDHSEDETKKIAQKIAERMGNLRVIDAPNTENSFKKAAVAAGIAAAKGSVILQTDADCVVPYKWISAMSGFFSENTAFVSGPVVLSYENKTFQKLQSLEFMGLNALGGGCIGAKKPNMCNGANLAYKREVFYEVGGFQGVDGVASGDDELLLQKIDALKKYEIRYAFAESAIVETECKKSLSEFWGQRLRWVSKARYYKNRWINFTQLMSYFGFVGLFASLVLGFFYPIFFALFGFLFLWKCRMDWKLMKKATRFFNKPKLLRWFLPLQIVYVPYILLIGIAGNFVKTYHWKGREVR